MFMYIKKICQSYLDSCLASRQLTIVTANANSRKFSSAQGFLPRVVITLLLVLLLRQNCDDFSKFTNISSLQFVNHHTCHFTTLLWPLVHKLTKLRIFCFSEIDGNFQVFWLVKTQKQNKAIGQRQSSCAVCLLYRVTSSLVLSFGSIFGSWYFLILGQNWLQKIEDNFIFKSFNFCQAKVRIWSNTRDITVKVITIKWVRKIPKIRAITY